VLSFVVIVLLLTGWARLLMSVVTLLVVALLFWIDIVHPELVFPLTYTQRFIDTLFTFLITAAFIAIVVAIQNRMSLLERARTEAAARAKGDFLAQMSHEMRTPMNAILGMSNIARQATDETTRNTSIAKIESASKHLLGVINDILDMSKIEAGKLELAPADFDFEAMIDTVVNISGSSIASKSQHFDCSIDERIPRYLHCDSQRLAQVITNLMSNASKFTAEGGSVGLTVAYETTSGGGGADDGGVEDPAKVPEAGGGVAGADDGAAGANGGGVAGATAVGENDDVTLCVSVTDNGIGISSEALSRLFKPFEQADNSTTRVYGGTGLGLVISQRIIEAMGGHITVTSTPGAGSCFSFTITVPQAKGTGEQQWECDGLEVSADDLDLSDHTILLVEDVEVNREIAIALLEPTGVSIDTALNGREAVEAVRADPTRYSLILMDIQMPVMDGYEAAQQIRALEAGGARSLPIIAMTANVFKEDVDKCRAVGMDDHVGKPIDVTELLGKIACRLR
jgi:signal transduction histidine kinase/CheY-like chemotaxis protein